MKNTSFILLLIIIASFSSCTKEELPAPEISAASIELIIPTQIEKDTTRLGLYLEKKVMKGSKPSKLKGLTSSAKSP